MKNVQHAKFPVVPIALCVLYGVAALLVYRLFVLAGHLSGDVWLLLFVALGFVLFLASVVSMFGMRVSRSITPWMYPSIIAPTIPAAIFGNILLHFPFITVAERAQNTQGYAAAAILSILVIFLTVASFAFLALPLLVGVGCWAEKDTKKFVIMSGVSFVVLATLIWIFSGGIEGAGFWLVNDALKLN